MQTSQPNQYFQLDTPQQTLALHLAAGTMVQVTQGVIWLTLEGHSRDVWLTTHDHWNLPLNAKVWISAEAGVAAFTVRQPTALQPRVTRRVRAGRPPVAVAA